VAFAACVVALVPAGLRWLRVAQREHYLGGSCPRFAWRWWTDEPADVALAVVALAGAVACLFWPLAALVTAVAVAVGPLHLSVRGRTSRLAFTRRLRLLAAVSAAGQVVVLVVGVVVGLPVFLAALGALGVPLVVDGAARLLGPVEFRLTQPFVDAATERLARVAPTVVAITGSYGKTSTKNHVAALVSGSRPVVASPASFNNRPGLARAINEHLSEGTEVFVAEMGIYGPGEIAAMCRWCPPSISVITAIGPVHLERMGTEDAILEAKAEITVPAEVVVLNVDDPRLAGLADRLEADGSRRVLRCSAVDHQAAVCVERTGDQLALWVGGRRVGRPVPAAAGLQPTNLACAAAVALELGVDEALVGERLGGLGAVANRLASATAPSGVVVLDDTYNANPPGTRAALAALAAVGAPGRTVVVTPGMVELGRRQAEENRAFAAAAAAVATDLVIVGRTNRRALREGWSRGAPVEQRTREQAVAWVRQHLGPGDAVLYENDLPDHYP
jgi:UDP-N-acetylmuramoyl-tripeptide--D-alanyl-D-alanine ligase